MANEFYRYISYDSRDVAQVQFYVRVINNATYLDFTYLNPRNLEWIESIEPNDLIAFYQDDSDRGTAKVLAAYDTENGFRIEEAPMPALNEGQYYEIRFSRLPPADQIPTPPENRGWSPLFAIQYLNYDGTTYTLSNTATATFTFRVADWTSGQGQKPQLGYLGINGLVGDVNDAAIITLPQGAPGTRGTQWTQATTLPTTGLITGDINLFPEAVASGLTNYFEADGTTPKAAAAAGEVAYWDGTKWRFVMVLSTGGTGGSRAFTPSIELGVWENANIGAISGHYSREATNTRVDINYTNIANEDKTTELQGIQNGFGLVFGEKIFVIEYQNHQNSYREFNGFWVNNDPDATAESAQTSIKVIAHELRMARFITADQIRAKIPELQTAVDKTVDIHLQETPGDFVDMNDATVAGIALILNNTANRAALDARNFNFAGLTWANTEQDIPNDGNEYWVVVRVARELGHIETQFQLINDDPEEGTEHLRRSRQGDDTWLYYQVTADRESVWTLQRRATDTHTRWDAPVGDVALRQMQALIPEVPEHEGLTPQQKAQFESLIALTADLILETRETWALATDAGFLALPADNAQLARVRAGQVPQGLTGWTNDVTTTEARVILIRVPISAQLADYRILIGDDNAVRLNAYAVNITDGTYAYMTSTSLILQEATRIRLQHHGSDTHTRFIGMLADAIMARLLPEDFTATDLTEMSATIRTILEQLTALDSRIDDLPVAREQLWATSATIPTTPLPRRILDTNWVMESDLPTGVVGDGDDIDMPETLRGDLHVEMLKASDDSLIQRKIVPIEPNILYFEHPVAQNIRIIVRHTHLDDTKLSLRLDNVTDNFTLDEAIKFKVYSFTAQPSGRTVAPADFDALTQRVTDVNSKFTGVPLNGPAAGGDRAFTTNFNLNKYIPQSNWDTVPVFWGTVLRRDPPQFGESTVHLALFESVLIRITFYLGEFSAERRAESTDFFVNVAEWDSLKTIPLPDQATAENPTNRIQIIASTKDNRALVHEFPQVTPGVFHDILPATGEPTADQLRALETATQKHITDLKYSKRFIYVGKSNETNPRLLLAISGTDQDVIYEAIGYRK